MAGAAASLNRFLVGDEAVRQAGLERCMRIIEALET